jgi:4-amino-4-deoxy-L-arabinose transferase-like glycosyltransferase
MIKLPNARTAILALTGVTACKVLLFLAFLIAGYAQPYIGTLARDHFLPVATRIITTGAYNDPSTSASSLQAPGYPFFLALLQLVSGRWYLSVAVCLQMLFDYCVALILLFLGKSMTSLEAGWLAGVLWLIFPPAIVISTWITAETLFTALLTLAIVMFLRGLFSPALALSFAAGITLGLATIVRGTTLLLPFVFFSIAYFRDIPNRLLKCAVFVIGMWLVVLPWTARNLYVLGEPIVVQTAFGAVFLQGSRSEWFTIEGMRKDYFTIVRQSAEEGLVAPVDGKATSLERWRVALGVRNYRIRLREEPWSLIPFAIHKFAYLWYGTQTGHFSKQLVLVLCALAVVPAGVIQLWFWRKEQSHLAIVSTLLLLYFVCLHMVTAPEFRYMLPVYPLLIFAASHQYTRLLNRTQDC